MQPLRNSQRLDRRINPQQRLQHKFVQQKWYGGARPTAEIHGCAWAFLQVCKTTGQPSGPTSGEVILVFSRNRNSLSEGRVVLRSIYIKFRVCLCGSLTHGRCFIPRILTKKLERMV